MNVCVTIPFPSAKIASMVYEVLNVDKDLKRSEVQRTLKVDEANVVLFFHGDELRRLRVAVNAAIKNIKLIVKTVNQFENKAV